MKIKLGVFFGGKSVEHEVSIITALQAIENMNREKYDIVPIYIAKDNKMYCGDFVDDIKQYTNIENLKRISTQVTLSLKDNKTVLLRTNKKFYENEVYDYIDVAFPIVHGTNVEDGTLQGYLKMFNLPYVGCDVTSSAVGMDKYVSKTILKENNIPVLDCRCYYKNEEVEDIVKNVEENIEYPVIVKPINLGSSIGIVVAKSKEELEEAIEDAFTYARKILIEKAIKNLKEVNCSVLGDYEECNASECEELDKTSDILSYEDKYISGGKKTGGAKQSMNAGVLKLPADISKELKEKIQTLAKETFKILGCTGVIRIDFLIDEDTDKVYVNEVNTIPGCLSFHLWRAAGMEYPELLDKEIELALKRNREENNMIFSFDTNVLEGYANGGLKGGKGKLEL